MEEEKEDDKNRIASSEEISNAQNDYSREINADNKNVFFENTHDDKSF